MNTCRPLLDLDEAPLSVRHLPEFAPTQAEVHQHTCSACAGGACPTPDACQLPIAQATRPPRAAFWLLRLITTVRLALLRWHLECLRDERDHYRALGMVGPIYMRNSWQEELRLRRAIRDLTT